MINRNVMKYISIIINIFIAFSINAQSTLTVEVSADTIGMEDAVKVTYKLIGSQEPIEILPWEGLQQVAGPNVSSSFSYVNGVSSQEYSQSYILVPTQEGSIYIPSASVVIDGEALETEPLEIFVMAVPTYDYNGKGKSQKKVKKKIDPKEDEEEYQRLIKKRELAKKKKKF